MKWLIIILLAVVAGCLLIEIGLGVSAATGQVTSAAGGDVVAVAGQLTSDSYGIYLIDTRKGTMAVYQWLPNVKKLRLLAARNLSYDLQLDEFNTEPLVRQIKQLVEQHRSLGAE
ncbi:MAG: hypothetical protein KAX78_04160 [Phycisphaerae bacterium]|nr:hypothetical protein [Phycisphaerae bacterium]